MKKLLIGLLAGLLLAAPALGQSPKTKTQMNTEIDTNFPDNNAGLITPQKLRDTTKDMVASWANTARVNTQSGTSYTVTVDDYGLLITFNNASPVAVTLPQAVGSFATFTVHMCNLGAGTATVTPVISVINGQTNIQILQTQCRSIVSDGTNWQVYAGSTTGGGGVVAITCATSNWISAISGGGVATCTQPAFTDISGTLAVNKGGTGITSGTAGGIPYFQNNTAIQSSAALTQNGLIIAGAVGNAPTSISPIGTVGQLLFGSGTAPAWRTPSGDIVGSTAAGIITVQSISNGTTPTVRPTTDSTAAVTITNSAGTNSILRVDTTNSRVGINKTPGAFDFDVNGTANVGNQLTFGTQTITNLTTAAGGVIPANDYLLYFSAADNAIRKCTVTVCTTSGVSGVSSLNSQTGALTITGAGAASVATVGTTITVSGITLPQGRLTTVAGTPVLNLDQVNATNIVYTCYQGSLVPYFDGTVDRVEAIPGCNVTTAMVSAATAGQVVIGNLYDVFWVHSGANRICLAMSSTTGGGGGWSSDAGGSNTVRGTGYSALDFAAVRPYITNKNSINACYNGATNYGPVAANQGTYLGTIWSTANGAVSMVFHPSSQTGGSSNVLSIFNAYNQVPGMSLVRDTSSSWTTTNVNFEAINVGNGGATGWRVIFVDGLGRTPFQGSVYMVASNSVAGSNWQVGTLVDSTTGTPGQWGAALGTVGTAVTVIENYYPFLGVHSLQGVQRVSGNTGNFSGLTFSGMHYRGPM